jgi:hypothetical protein
MSGRFQTTPMRIVAGGRVRSQGVVDEARGMNAVTRNCCSLVVSAGLRLTVTVPGASCGPSKSAGSAPTATKLLLAPSTAVDPTRRHQYCTQDLRGSGR